MTSGLFTANLLKNDKTERLNMKKYTLEQLNKKYHNKDIFINASMVPSFNWSNRGIKEFTIKTSSVCRENFETLDAINRRFN